MRLCQVDGYAFLVLGNGKLHLRAPWQDHGGHWREADFPITMLSCIHGSKAGYNCRPLDKVAKEGKSDALRGWTPDLQLNQY